MPNGMLTLADVWNPLESALNVQQLDEMRSRNRLQAMQMQEFQKSKQFKNNLSNVWQGLLGTQQGAGGPQAASPPNGSPAPAPQQPQAAPQGQAQPQQPQGQPQPQQAPNPSQQKLKFLVDQAHEYIRTGQDDKLQQLTQWGYSQPDIAPLLEKSGIISMNTYGPDKYEQTVTLDDKGVQARIAKNPELKDVLTKPGTYKLRYEKAGGKEYATLAEPVKDVSKESDKLTDEQIVHNALKEKLGREPSAQELLKAVEEHKAPGVDNQVKEIGDAVMAGKQSPIISGFGMAKLAAPLKAYLAKQGFDLKTAELDFDATKKHLQTLNGSQQTRLRQAVNTAYESLDKIDDLAKQWKGGKFPPLNKTNLMAAKNGAYGQNAASIATQLDGQITDVTSELGNVYMGGNSPTDHALQLAGKNLQGSWSEKVLLDMTKLARTNLQYRQNSMDSLGAAGLSTGPVKVDKPSGERVKVKSPNGKVGTIPADQLEEAIKEGYAKVE